MWDCFDCLIYNFFLGIGPDIPPGNLRVTYRSYFEISISWDPITGLIDDVTDYVIEIQLTKKDSVALVEQPITKLTVKSSVLMYDFRMLQANSFYRISVAGQDGIGAGRRAEMGKSRVRIIGTTTKIFCYDNNMSCQLIFYLLV